MARTGGAPQPTITPDSALGGSVIERGLRFNDANSANLTRTSSSASTTFTYSAWIRRCGFAGYYSIFSMGNQAFSFHTNNQTLYLYDGSSLNESTAKFRDANGWYHIVVQINSGVATSYVNNVLVHNAVGGGAFTLTTGTNETRIGSHASTYYFNGYQAEIHLVDGSVVAPTSFGYTEFQTGIWRPKRYEGTYGTNGFYLDFSDNSSAAALGIDKSPNGNDFTANNFSVSDGINNDSFTTHTPTSENEFATLNSNLPISSGAQYRNGNYTFYMNHSDYHMRASSNMPVNSGKWYAEFKLTTYSFQSGSYPYIGVCADDLWINSWAGDAGTAYQTGGTIWRNGSSISSGHSTYTQGDTISIAIDLDQGTPKIWWAKNGTYINSGNPATNTNGTDIAPTSNTGYYNFAMSLWASTGQWDANFGQRAFSYDVPSGFKTLCTDNVRSTQSIIPKQHFDVLTWTGNGSTGQNITGLNFKPDLLWIKKRNESESWGGYDSVRGVNKRLYINDSNVEQTITTLSAFYHGGFRVEGSGGGATNDNNDTYVGFCWKAGGATTVANTDGDQTTQVTVNEEAGLSIVTYTGTGSNTNIGHGLGGTPDIVITKSRSATGSWAFLDRIGNSTAEYGLFLNDNGGYSSYQGGTYWNDTLPTSTVFRVSSNAATNASGVTYVAYCWRSIPGYSKIGTYEANNSSNGPYVHLGFQPKWVMMKPVDSGGNWQIYDTTRTPINKNDGNAVYADLTNAEASGFTMFDFLSNGFKNRNSGSGGINYSGTYIYMAFAEQSPLTAFPQANPNAR